MKKFVLVDGYISIDNSKLYIDINNLKSDIKNRGGLLSIFFVFIGISVYNSFRKQDYFEKVSHYLDFGLRILGMITIVCVIWYLLFMRKSKKNLIINEITKLEIEKKEFESELTIIFSNKKRIDISFRNLENQLTPFIEELQKKNSRILINNL